MAVHALSGAGGPNFSELGRPIILHRATGSVVEDVDGNRFLDFCAGLTAGIAGHAHAKMVAGMECHIGCSAANGGMLLSPAESQLGERFSAILPHGKRYRSVITGHRDCACAIMAAVSRAYRNRGTIVTFNDLAETGASWLPKSTGTVKLDWPFDHADLAAFRERLERAAVDPGDIAAVVMNPLATMRPCDALDGTFAAEVYGYCRDNDILFVWDESVSGMGRTGEWFGLDRIGLTPDIILVLQGLAAGMPLAATFVADEVAAAVPSAAFRVDIEPHPISCAMATALMDLVHSTALSNARRIGAWLDARLCQVSAGHKAVGRTSGWGLLHAVEIVNRKSRRPDARGRDIVLRHCLQRGLLLAPVCDAGIRFCPPACVNEAQLDVGLTLFEEALSMLP